MSSEIDHYKTAETANHLAMQTTGERSRRWHRKAEVHAKLAAVQVQRVPPRDTAAEELIAAIADEITPGRRDKDLVLAARELVAEARHDSCVQFETVTQATKTAHNLDLIVLANVLGQHQLTQPGQDAECRCGWMGGRIFHLAHVATELLAATSPPRVTSFDENVIEAVQARLSEGVIEFDGMDNTPALVVGRIIRAAIVDEVSK